MVYSFRREGPCFGAALLGGGGDLRRHLGTISQTTFLALPSHARVGLYFGVWCFIMFSVPLASGL